MNTLFELILKQVIAVELAAREIRAQLKNPAPHLYPAWMGLQRQAQYMIFDLRKPGRIPDPVKLRRLANETRALMGLSEMDYSIHTRTLDSFAAMWAIVPDSVSDSQLFAQMTEV